MQAQRRFAREDDMTDDMEALLAELNGAGGEVDVGAARPYSKHGRARGTVGSVSVLGEQQRGLARAKSDVSGRGSRPNSGTSAATTAFSTYNVGLTEKEVQNTRHHVTPLGVRLQPLGGSSSPGGQRSPAKVAALPALRSGGDEPLRLESNAPMAFRFAGANDSSPSVEAPTSAEVAPAEPLLALKKPNQPSTAAVLNDVAQGPREANFLPIMCARYLRPSGLTPPARWGHSLTSMSGSALLMFGGMDVSGDETNALMEFSSSTISWDPAFVSRGAPPTARHSHAACAWDGRWLVVHGGTSRSGIVFGDIFIYDTLSCEWECVWASSGTAQRNDPGPRYGHTIVMRDDRLYVFGGRVVKSATSGSTTTALASADVYVFSMSSRRWRKRIRAGGKKTKTEENGGKAKTSTTAQEGASPAPRASHAACLKGDVMYISGGSSTGARVLSDTWSLQLSTNEWRCLHPGEAADAIPRESHALFVCGEALMCVGGCSTSMYNERVSGKFTNFVAVLPLVGQPSPCWIPVAMGNVAIVAPNKKSFGAAFSGGFVYVFGGMCGAEPATNTMVRFLAADGYVSEMEQSSTGSNDDALRGMMQQLRESNPVVPADMFAIAATWGGVNDETGCFVDKEHAAVGFHRQLLVKRAPALLEALLACRSEQLFLGGADTMKHAKGATDGASSQGGGVQVYFTNGTSRVKGLPEPITPDVLSCLADYIYWGGLRSKYRILLEEEEAANGEDEEGSPAGANDGQRTAVLAMMESLKTIANSYQLSPLAALCDALLTRSRRHLQRAREASAECLRKDLLSMMESGTGATLTVLFVDPHTKKQTTCAVHPFVVASASSFFSDLLRPLYTGAKTTFQVGPVAAKVQASTGALPLQCSTSKRAVLVGPVSVPTPAVKSILRFLYTQSLTVRREHAFDTMLGAHQLGLSQLQSYCEAIIAREDVNYDSCCSFYYLSRKYAASLLEEMSLLTAVSGFSSVHQSPGYASLSDADKKSISVVAEELGSNSWVPPPQPKHELKSAAQYESRWKGSAS